MALVSSADPWARMLLGSQHQGLLLSLLRTQPVILIQSMLNNSEYLSKPTVEENKDCYCATGAIRYKDMWRTKEKELKYLPITPDGFFVHGILQRSSTLCFSLPQALLLGRKPVIMAFHPFN